MRNLKFSVAEGVSWVVESAGLLIFREEEAIFLAYPEAAVWDLLSQGQKLEAVVHKLELITTLSSETAKSLVESRIEQWRDNGLLTAEAANG